MTRLFRQAAVAAAVCCALPSAAAQAESIAINAGTAVFDPLAGPGPQLFANLRAETFSVSLRWDATRGPCISQCAAGDVVSLFSTTFPVSPREINAVTGPVENTAVGGVDGLTNLAFAGQLRFLGPDVVLPLVPLDADIPFPVTFTERFTFSGSLSGFVVLGVLDPRLVFSQDLSGWGTMRARFLSTSRTGYFLNRIEYDFEPVPEPSTMLLLGTGLAACAGRRYRAANRQSPGGS